MYKVLIIKAASRDTMTPPVTLTAPAFAVEGSPAANTFDATGTLAIPLPTTIPPLTVQVLSSQGGTSTATVSVVNVTPLDITTTILPDGVVNAAYSQVVAATGGTLPYVWSDAGLPSGLSIDPATGVISGTPALGGTYTVDIQVTDVGGLTEVKTFTLTIEVTTVAVIAPNGGEELVSGMNLNVTWDSAPSAVFFHLRYWDGSAYQLLKANATGNSYTWVVPTVASRTTGNFFHVTAMNASGVQLGWDLSDDAFAINPPALTLTAPANGATFIAPASVDLTVSAGPGVTSVDYFSNGVLLGTVAAAPFTFNLTGLAAGTYTITAQGHDGVGNTFSAGSSTITVSNPKPVTVTAPNGGEELVSGTPVTVTWNSAPNAVLFHLRYWDGSIYKLLKGNATGNSFIWTVPTVAVRTTGNYFHITAMDSGGARLGWDLSDTSFAINP